MKKIVAAVGWRSLLGLLVTISALSGFSGRQAVAGEWGSWNSASGWAGFQYRVRRVESKPLTSEGKYTWVRSDQEQLQKDRALGCLSHTSCGPTKAGLGPDRD